MAHPEKKSTETDPRRHRVVPALIVAALTVVLSLALKSYTDLSSTYQTAIAAVGCVSALLLTRQSWSTRLGLNDPASLSGRSVVLIALVVIALVIAAVAGGWVSAHDPDEESHAGDKVVTPTGNNGVELDDGTRAFILVGTQALLTTVAAVEAPPLAPVVAVFVAPVVAEDIADTIESVSDLVDGPNTRTVHPPGHSPIVSPRDSYPDGGPEDSDTAHFHDHQEWTESNQGANMPGSAGNTMANQLSWECLWHLNAPGNVAHNTCGEWGWR